jgi:hypothetical protein
MRAKYAVDRPLVTSQRKLTTKNQEQKQRRRSTTPASSQQYNSWSNLSNENDNNSNDDDDDNNLDCSANTILLQSWDEMKDTTAPAKKMESNNDDNDDDDNLNVEYGKLEFLKQELEHKMQQMYDTNHNITTTTTTTDSPPPPATATTKGGGGGIIQESLELEYGRLTFFKRELERKLQAQKSSLITNPLLLPRLQESTKLHDTTNDTTTTLLAIHRDNDITSSKSGSRHQCNDEDNERIPSREEVTYGMIAYQRRMEELDKKRKRKRSNNHDIMDLSSMNDIDYYNIANKYNKTRRVLPRGDDKHSSANHRYERQHDNIVDDEYNNPEDNYFTTTNHRDITTVYKVPLTSSLKKKKEKTKMTKRRKRHVVDTITRCDP